MRSCVGEGDNKGEGLGCLEWGDGGKGLEDAADKVPVASDEVEKGVFSLQLGRLGFAALDVMEGEESSIWGSCELGEL